MQAVQRIFASRQRIEDALVIELARYAQMLRVARDGVEIGQHFLHAAEFGLERGLLLFFTQTIDTEFDPGRLLQQDIERLLVIAQEIHVEQAGHQLVDRVIRRPDTFTLVHKVEKLFGKGRQIAWIEAPRRERLLNLRQPSY